MAFLRQRGKVWYIYYYDNLTKGTKAFSTKFKEKSAANKELKKFIARRTLQLRPDNFVKASESQITLNDSIKMFLNSRELSAKSRQGYLTAFQKLSAAIGNPSVRSVVPLTNVNIIHI